MIDSTTRITDALPAITGFASLTPVDFKDIPYASFLLLCVSFDTSIMSDSIYPRACSCGFVGYFEDMYDDDGVFVNRFYTRSEVCALVGSEVCADESHVPLDMRSSLAWRVGYYVGWLSALALTDRAVALVGLHLLAVLVDRLQSPALDK